MVPQEISMILSSDPNNGAINRSSDGSYFEVQMQDGLSLPSNALNPTLSVEEATVWWSVPNIITGKNDKMYFNGPLVNDTTTNIVITIPQGLYDLSGLNQAILRELESAGAKIDPYTLITFSPDQATQKVQMRVNYSNVVIDFTYNDTPREILGFNSETYGPYATTPVSILAPNIASFNQINYFLIHSDLTNKGIRFNNDYNQTMCQVLIDVSPGSQIISTPFNPAKINVSELINAKRNNIRMWITDDNNNRINTNGEYWSVRLVIRYLIVLK